MSSREIAELTGKDHAHVMRDIRTMLDELLKMSPNLDSAYKSTTYKVEGQLREYPVYELSYDLTMTLVSGYSIPLRHKVVTRLSELEKGNKFQVPETKAGLLRLALEQEERLEAQALQIEYQRPAVEFVDKYTKAQYGSMKFRQVCKQLNANEARFREFLFDNDIMYRLNGDLMAYQNHIDAQRFEVKTETFGEKNRPVCYFTGKGIVWVADKWSKSNRP